MTQAASQANFPRRGQIWTFQDLSGVQLGVVVSDCARNEQANNVLIVPLSPSPLPAPGQPLVQSAVSGHSEDCRAACSELTRVDKQDLLERSTGNVPETVMMQIVKAVRSAIGDTLMHPVH